MASQQQLAFDDECALNPVVDRDEIVVFTEVVVVIGVYATNGFVEYVFEKVTVTPVDVAETVPISALR